MNKDGPFITQMPSKILVVEDEPGYQELAAAVLAEYDLTICSSGEEASAVVKEKGFDLVLCDINLMGVSGLHFIGTLSKEGLSEKIPVVMCSSQDDAETKRTVAELGAAGFICKPYENETLLKVIQSFLGPPAA